MGVACINTHVHAHIHTHTPVQDLRVAMESQYEEISRWKRFCLENTCQWLQKKFPNSAIWIVRPSRMLRNLFSSFHNFVQSSITGVPEYGTSHGAIPNLERMLRDAVTQVHARGGVEKGVAELQKLPVVLVGFSKGCVVLNQIVYELVNFVSFPNRSYSTGSNGRGSHSPSPHDSPRSSGIVYGNHVPRPSPRTSPRTSPRSSPLPSPSSSPVISFQTMMASRDFVARFKALYWLDGGHSGTGGAWVTDDELLMILASLRATVHVHVTPHQVNDPHRPWIGEEKTEFVAKLRKFGATVTDTLHFKDDEPSLEKHFRVLEEF